MGKMLGSGWTRAIQEGGLDVGDDCMASSVAGSNSDGFSPAGTPEEASLSSSSQNYRRSRGKTSSSCDNGQRQHVKVCSRECRTAHCHLPWNGRRLLWTPIVTTSRSWFDHLIACAIWRWRVYWKLNVTGYILRSIFDLLLTRNRTMKSLCANFVSPCIYSSISVPGIVN
jgi:hypothetical protein